MYFSSTLSIAPSEVSKIEKTKPTKAFKRILYLMSGGRIADKIEIENFTAVSILQQLYRVFASTGITNIIRLSQDDIDFYLDDEGKEDDLKEALDHYDLEINEAMSKKFGTLHMVLEHHDDQFTYLIDVKINRTHEVGANPIEIVINGLLKELEAKPGTSAEAMKAGMEQVFKDQQTYDAYVLEKRGLFEGMANTLQLNIKKFMKVDEVEVTHANKIMVPKEQVTNPADVKRNRDAYDPVYHGYYGYDNSFFYGYMWSSMMHDHHMHVHDTQIVADDGMAVGSIGDEPLDAGDSTLFDPDADFYAKIGSTDLA